MSYEVYFTMTTDKGEERTIEAFSGLDELKELWEVDITPGEFAQGRFGHSFENEFLGYTIGYPDVLFNIECEDSTGDRWMSYYRNGKHQICAGRTVYEEFQEDKL